MSPEPQGRACEDPDLIERSLHEERETGADSIPTIERVYERTATGAYRCVYPGCAIVRRSPAAMWRHVHGSAHVRRAPERTISVSARVTPWELAALERQAKGNECTLSAEVRSAIRAHIGVPVP